MDKKSFVIKIMTNKYLLFFLPYLVFLSRYFFYYIHTEKYDYIMPLSSTFWFFLSVLLISILVMLLLNRITKNNTFNCILVSFFMFLHFIIYDLWILAIIGIVVLIIAFVFRKISFKEYILVFINMFFTFMFLFTFSQALFRFFDLLINTNHDNADYTVLVDKKIESKPNIYYVHCDGMMSMEAMTKYFDYNDKNLNDYLESNNFIINRNIVLPVGHRTQKSLVALFNPYYYDKKEKKFLEEYEKNTDNPKYKVTNYITYEELRDKRLNSELLQGLSSAKYTTYGVGIYSQYSSLNTDYYYDFNYFGSSRKHNEKNLKLSLIDKNVSENVLNNYINYQITIDVNPNESIIKDMGFDYFASKFKSVKNRRIDLSNYSYLNSTSNEKTKMVVEGLSYVFDDTSDNKFVFVDFDLNHLYISFDKDGNEIEDYDNFKDSYRDNYIYISYLLTDLIQYIKDNDNNSIIVLQSDHGIHILDCNELKESLNVEDKDCYDIRNSMFSSIYVPDSFKNGNEDVLSNPLNISRYLINNYVGENYKYLK